jgi:uncharacterized protein (TIGR03435 family)
MKAVLISAVAVCLAIGQRASFDVATLKIRKGPSTFSSDPVVRGRMVTANAVNLRDLLTYAYSVRYEQLGSGPSWTADDHYDLVAKSEGEGELTTSEARQMMQALLADRFQLQVHSETRETPMYALVVAKDGPKMKPSAPDTIGRCSVSGSGKGMRMEGLRCTMDFLAKQLAGTSGRFVVNHTRLVGPYAITLNWWPANGTPPPDSEVPSMFAALQEQLGLKLEAIRGPLEMLVIDRAEKPLEN